ncbi:MAG TPA: hypothetical protein VFH46_17285 [Pyrinomonadaceae bacterium]|nr:hypothetical protein [Pyrinomonadaceae bacterium]
MKKKSEAALKAICVYLAINALMFGGGYVSRWIYGSSFGHWLEIDKPYKPPVPGGRVILQIFALIVALFYYRDQVKRG